MDVRRRSKARRDYELRDARRENIQLKSQLIDLSNQYNRMAQNAMKEDTQEKTEDNMMAVLLMWIHSQGLMHQAAAALLVKTDVLAKLLPKRLQEGYINDV